MALLSVRPEASTSRRWLEECRLFLWGSIQLCTSEQTQDIRYHTLQIHPSWLHMDPSPFASCPFQLPLKASWQGGCCSSESRQQADSTWTIFHHFGHSNDPLTSCIFSLPRSWQAPSDNKAHVANCTFHNRFVRNEGLTQKLCYCNLLYWWSRNFRTRQISPLIPYHI